MRRNLRFEVIYPHAPARVWRALTSPQELAAWLMDNDFAPQLGHRLQFRTKPAPGFDGIVNCEVLEIDEPRRLVYSWQANNMRRPTIIRWTLEPVAEGTRLVLEHNGFEGAAGLLASAILGRGWRRTVLPRLGQQLAQPEPQAHNPTEADSKEVSQWASKTSR